MRRSSARRLVGVWVALAACVLFAFPFVSPAQNVGSSQDADIDDETCLGCHEKVDQSIEHTAHRLSSQTKEPAITIGCVSCHGSAEAHLDDPSRDTMTSPSELEGFALRELCTKCHKGHDALDNYGYDAHSIAEIGCGACHTIHGTDASLLVDDGAEFCLKCHTETRDQFRKRSNHPVLQANVTCLSCHRFVQRHDRAAMYDLARTCRDCHPEQGGPFLFEHQAVNAYSASGVEGCLDCHRPHGSENDRLLKLPADRICAQCHFPALHRTAHEGAFAGQPCQLCHIETHGSFSSNLFLDPDMPAKTGAGFDCYQSGCHKLIK